MKNENDKGTCGCLVAIILVILLVNLIWGQRGCVPKPKTINIEIPFSFNPVFNILH